MVKMAFTSDRSSSKRFGLQGSADVVVVVVPNLLLLVVVAALEVMATTIANVVCALTVLAGTVVVVGALVALEMLVLVVDRGGVSTFALVKKSSWMPIPSCRVVSNSLRFVRKRSQKSGRSLVARYLSSSSVSCVVMRYQILTTSVLCASSGNRLMCAADSRRSAVRLSTVTSSRREL